MYTEFEASLYKHHNSAYILTDGIGVKAVQHDTIHTHNGVLHTDKGTLEWVTPFDINELHDLEASYADAPWFEHETEATLRLYYVGQTSPAFLPTTLINLERFASMDDFYLVDMSDKLIFEVWVDERKQETIQLLSVNEQTIETAQIQTVQNSIGDRYKPVIRVQS